MANSRWREPKYKSSEINHAGELLRKNDTTEEERKNARRIVNNWRESHAYPLHIIYKDLRNKANNRSDIVVAERLKRMDSIEKKLKQQEGMNLYRMQDLGGCRVVLPTVEEVYRFSQSFNESGIRHELKKTKDYIQEPKPSGYRSLHQVYRYHSNTRNKKIYNEKTMLVEIQFRTYLQHLWATAIESFGFITNQDLKGGKGTPEVIRFFALVSSLFAIKEGCPIVPGTPNNTSDIILEITKIDKQYHLLNKMRAINIAKYLEVDQIIDKKAYYILRLNYETGSLNRWFFKESEVHKANEMYELLEREKGNNPFDIVLISTESFNTVKAAYPNYFMDIDEFVAVVMDFLNPRNLSED